MTMPIIETYRGVGIHDFQDDERISSVVKPAIDHIFTVSDPDILFDYAGDPANPPEARQFAADKVKATQELRARDHVKRLNRIELLDAMTAGVDSLNWMDTRAYSSILDVPPAPGQRRRAAPRPAEHGARLEAAKRANGRR